jgi:hypothetical protein
VGPGSELLLGLHARGGPERRPQLRGERQRTGQARPQRWFPSRAGPAVGVGGPPSWQRHFLDDISRRHAELRLENCRFRIVEVGGLHGTRVNHRRNSDSEPTSLKCIFVNRLLVPFETKAGSTGNYFAFVRHQGLG